MITIFNELVEQKIKELIDIEYINNNHLLFIKATLKPIKLYKIKNMVFVDDIFSIAEDNGFLILKIAYHGHYNEIQHNYIIKKDINEIIELLYDTNMFSLDITIDEIKEDFLYIRSITNHNKWFNVEQKIHLKMEKDFLYNKIQNVLEPILYKCFIEYLRENFKNKTIKNFKKKLKR